MFEFPDKDKIDSWNGKIHTLAGIVINGKGIITNFILSNGERSKIGVNSEKDLITTFDHFIPKYAINKIRSVIIYHDSCIHGFAFFDKDGAYLWKIGNNSWSWRTVLLAENEVIVGFKARTLRDELSYFQLKIATRWNKTKD